MSPGARPLRVGLICGLTAAAGLAVGALGAGAARSATAARAATAATATASAAIGPGDPVCGATGVLGAVGASACSGIGKTAGGDLLKAGRQLVTGNVGGAVNTAVGGATQAVASTAASAAFAALGPFVLGSAQAVLNDTAAALGETTTPQLRSTWFSSTYWRMAAIAAVVTLPFLFAAAVQALIRSDLALLARAALGYLPLAMLAIAIVAPLATLLLAASDQMCAFISAAAAGESGHFLTKAGVTIAAASALDGSPFLGVLVGLFTIGAAFVLWIELLMREAAVYVIVLMLPLAFAAMVWPARRIWAIRAVELLFALILSKFAIVAVLSLGGAAISESSAQASVAGIMAGAVLITLAAFSPWAMLRMVPLAEIAGGAAGALRGELRTPVAMAESAWSNAATAHDWAANATGDMQREAVRRGSGGGGDGPDVADRPAGPEPPPASPGEAPADPGETTGGAGGAGGEAGEVTGDAGEIAGDGGEAAHNGGDGPHNEASADDDVPASTAVPWSQQPVLELGADNLFATPVYPHEDAS